VAEWARSYPSHPTPVEPLQLSRVSYRCVPIGAE
jgi:hypothetical protein